MDQRRQQLQTNLALHGQPGLIEQRCGDPEGIRGAEKGSPARLDGRLPVRRRDLTQVRLATLHCATNERPLVELNAQQEVFCHAAVCVTRLPAARHGEALELGLAWVSCGARAAARSESCGKNAQTPFPAAWDTTSFLEEVAQNGRFECRADFRA